MWKSPNFDYLINGLAIGDVDADGHSEIVVVSPDRDLTSTVMKRASDGGRPPGHRLADRYNIGVDLADLNGNGRAEIFVTALNTNKSLVRSYVREYDGKASQKSPLTWPGFFGSATLPVRGRILLGQQSRLYQPYRGGIFEMGWDGGAYMPQNSVNIPRGRSRYNVLGTALGDVQNNGEETLVAYRSEQPHRHRLPREGSPSGKAATSSAATPSMSAGEITDNGQVENPIYLPTRILVRESDKAEERPKSQVIAVKNHEVMGMHWDRRDFTEASIEAFCLGRGRSRGGVVHPQDVRLYP